jgi:hypothetical protein
MRAFFSRIIDRIAAFLVGPVAPTDDVLWF